MSKFSSAIVGAIIGSVIFFGVGAVWLTHTLRLCRQICWSMSRRRNRCVATNNVSDAATALIAAAQQGPPRLASAPKQQMV